LDEVELNGVELAARIDQGLLAQGDFGARGGGFDSGQHADRDALFDFIALLAGDFGGVFENGDFLFGQHIVPVSDLGVGDQGLDISAQFVKAGAMVEGGLAHIDHVHGRAEAAQQGLGDAEPHARGLLVGSAVREIAFMFDGRFELGARRQALPDPGHNGRVAALGAELFAGGPRSLAGSFPIVLHLGEHFGVKNAARDLFEGAGDHGIELPDMQIAVVLQ